MLHGFYGILALILLASPILYPIYLIFRGRASDADIEEAIRLDEARERAEQKRARSKDDFVKIIRKEVEDAKKRIERARSKDDLGA